jgi:hypothetical protein
MVDTNFKTRDELRAIECPEPTKSWKPVPHYELVTTLIESLAAREIESASIPAVGTPPSRFSRRSTFI